MAYLQDPIPKTAPTLNIAGNTIGVFSGIIACLLLILRRKLAQPFFILSLIGLLVTVGFHYFKEIENDNAFAHLIYTLPVTISLLANWFTKFSIGKHWLK